MRECLVLLLFGVFFASPDEELPLATFLGFDFVVVFICSFRLCRKRCHSSWRGEDPGKTHVGPACGQRPSPPAEGTAEGEVQREPAGQERIPSARQGLGQELF